MTSKTRLPVKGSMSSGSSALAIPNSTTRSSTHRRNRNCLRRAGLARKEAKIALETMLPRILDWTVDLELASLTGDIDTRRWEHLPVQV